MHRTVVKSFAALASASLHGGIGRAGGGAGDRNAGGAFGRWRPGNCLHAQGGTEVYEAFPRHGEQHQARYVLKRLRDVAPDRTAVAALRHLDADTGSLAVRIPGGQVAVTVTDATSYLRGPSVILAHGEIADGWWRAQG